MDATTLKTQHDALAAATKHKLQTSTAVLRNGTSSHRIASPASFNMLDAFERATRDTVRANVPMFVGSVDGALRVGAAERRANAAGGAACGVPQAAARCADER